jgi:hypothetical protein
VIQQIKPNAAPNNDMAYPVLPRRIESSLCDRRLWALILLIIVIAAGAQFFGPLRILIGSASVDLLPMMWALLCGVLISGQRIKPLPVDLQHIANTIMSVAVLMLCARLSLTLGPHLPTVIAAGPALLLQELGNIFGSLLLALPLAVFLRMGPATVGATFSIDREPSFAMVTSRFGVDSPQYRGVLSMYVFGSVFGAVIVNLIATALSALMIFDWQALAMGAGVGSGSMMAAGIAAITAAHPEHADAIAALATTANLIASLGGVYLALYISLPVADYFYRFLSRNQTERASTLNRKISSIAAQVLDTPTVVLALWTRLAIFSAAGLITAIIAEKGFSFDMATTYAALSAMVGFGLWIERTSGGRLPALVVIITIGCLFTVAGMPTAEWFSETSSSVNLQSLITAVLAVAGLSIGKDLPMLREIGWKILPVGFVVISATFIASTVIAQFVIGG